ncbi:UPF0147 family protein [Candidatus Woesearchaeota archaeon]|nr:UPF0147 family protein [Candidatus Woesearchaeota archaeon]
MADEKTVSGDVDNIIVALTELEQDSTVPRNIKEKVQKTIEALKSGGEVSMNIDKALQELDEIAEDINLQPYARTQIWNIVSMLEKL